MSPSYNSLIQELPYLFKNKVITSNFIRFCLSEFNSPDLFFLAGMKDFNDNPTPERAKFLFEAFCTYSVGQISSTSSCLLNTTTQNVQITKNNIETAVYDYHFVNKFTLKIKNVKQNPKIPASLHSCLDELLKDVKTTLIGNYANLFSSENGIYHNYSNKSVFTKSNKSNTLINYKITNSHISEFQNKCGFMFGTIFKLEMKTMFNMAKEIQNMK